MRHSLERFIVHHVLTVTCPSRRGIVTGIFPGAIMRPPVEMRRIEFYPIDSGHFALEDSCSEIGGLTRDLLARVMPA